MRSNFIFLLAIAVVGRTPPGSVAPHVPPREKPHLKDHSDVMCSRAVSRWVRSVFRDLFTKKVGKDFEFPAECRLSEANDMFSLQEKKKDKRKRANNWKCRACGKQFWTELDVDNHMERQHLALHDHGLQGGNSSLVHPDYRKLRLTQGVSIDSYAEGGMSNSKEPGEVVTKFKKLPNKANLSSHAKAHAAIREGVLNDEFFGSCLEDYCDVFDVCDKPHTKQRASIVNEVSIIQDSICDPEKLEIAYDKCLDILDECLPLSDSSTEIRKLNRWLNEHLCGALESCQRYETRRLYSGSKVFYTRNAYLGRAWTDTQITGMILVGSLVSVVAIVVLTICCVTTQTPNKKSQQNQEIDYASVRGSTFQDWAHSGARKRL